MPGRSKIAAAGSPLIFTIGHSTHPIERFLELLAAHQVALVADVRSFPSSRKWPHFNQDALAESLRHAGLGYRWIKSLGGRRHGKRADSPHTAWEHPAFRSYADYTGSTDFAAGLDELCEIAAGARTAYMCSEGLWWRCHRRIISDHLLVRGWRVEHIMPAGTLSTHELTAFARVIGGAIVYAGSEIHGSSGTTESKPAR
ncbi:MAG TPA: DUF488 domain-containing protein [Candidatus Binataceae bacterium]|nr:DUF488 domain-containing protein [Candidatus Binataceae bacterium]